MSESSIGNQVLALVAQAPESTRRVSETPRQVAEKAAEDAAAKAALAAGAYALPTGPLGWLTVAPELMTVWRIQRQLVADIAAIYGQSSQLGPSQMLWCLFRHTAAQGLRDLAVRVGERLVVQPAAQAVLQRAAASIGLQLSQQVLGRALSRWVPLLGAAGVGAYAWYDTRQVARAAIALFEHETVIEA
jgi:hypothetical protein